MLLPLRLLGTIRALAVYSSTLRASNRTSTMCHRVEEWRQNASNCTGCNGLSDKLRRYCSLLRAPGRLCHQREGS
ncbi:hypothetical protein HBH56_214060 [Parastagonospora nodorum]|uniref:Uncharacterized protein n=1 Tax=Phaeosphaeria nodorum (strain SN15 / ATCC MYA-4574 / FGSC 10173) TaxID=321614 RepID=A0A7U2I2V1_PHANO|nr:hypothetical protein HBH56_214060 [Parastagonospora nodorum]QRC97816.1 hypothetical protein JI435_307310 [Parastagonospora nodorum SN15]KAH3923134.1 hypothetical protein HBH54_215730 [Parastagonospora nodorum]KAH3961071.1 hypothetical protein HBH51_186220 [Parastagonospora nodorum]KAH3992800.1 hypothetical protein HBI10_211890 [Parastagonospora nodorum]